MEAVPALASSLRVSVCKCTCDMCEYVCMWCGVCVFVSDSLVPRPSPLPVFDHL